MWKMPKLVLHIPFVDSQISEADEDKINFPLMTQNVFNIYLENKCENTYLTYADERFCRAYEQKAKAGDIITMSFIPKSCSNVMVDLVMEEIYTYSGHDSIRILNYHNEDSKIYNLGNMKISITTGGETPGYKPTKKYRISQPWADLLFVETNVEYLSGAKYIEKES